MQCGVCEKHKNSLALLPGGAIFEDENVFIAHFPVVPEEKAHFGHVILELKRHIVSPKEMSDLEATSVGLFTQRICRGLEIGLGAEHVYVVRIGDVTRHLHFHFVPRFKDTPQEFWGPLLFRWAGSRKATAADMIKITETLKSFL
jgi:histidine triad (HIT) family protein